ncbi:glycosyltransferase domain-containing protein [Mesorhizobium sp. Cs1299R1N3]|uniref:glycosyltransferase domain-containing protein n=1 Tax=Mesorhizobium sp. Cs1299R1N3 TaxID=3015173 RepID=UPI00301E4189
MNHRATQSFCVYTTMIGGYERLNEQPIVARSGMPFICLTDDPKLKSDTWQFRIVSPIFGMDPIRSQRALKLRPHVHLTEFSGSLYIDNTIILKEPPELIVDRYWCESGFSVPTHSYRETVMDEFIEVARLGLDDQSRIFEQLNHYLVECPEALADRPFWNAILLRDHTDPTVCNMSELWSSHVLRYSRRDQLSINYAFRKTGLKPGLIAIDTFSSWFHDYSHFNDRDNMGGIRDPINSLMPPRGRIRDLEATLIKQQLVSTEQERIHEATVLTQMRSHEEALTSQAYALNSIIEATANRLAAIEASKSWKVARFLRQQAVRYPKLAKFFWYYFDRP